MVAAVSNNNEREIQIPYDFLMEGINDDYGDGFSNNGGGTNFLDSIDFDELFMGIGDDDVLPDLEMMDQSQHSLVSAAADDDFSLPSYAECSDDSDTNNNNNNNNNVVVSVASSSSNEMLGGEDHAPVSPDIVKSKKSSSSAHHRSKNPTGKKKPKVDWTAELHKRFVKVVEQLGVDKAVPSRILELMGIDCLTRHNIASHLQKYRSHRKHLLAREAEAASWSQRRQMYGTEKRSMVNNQLHPNWNNIAPSYNMGFPPATPLMQPHLVRPLHVWGHPSIDQSLMHMWHKHPQPPPWQLAPHHPLPPDPSFWHQYVHNAAGTPCSFPMHLPQTVITKPSLSPLIPAAPGKVVEADLCIDGAGQKLTQPPLSDVHPSKERIDAAIGDVIAKPWLPLPLGLKPPSMDSVIVELKRQGIPKIPPSSTSP
ncbi:hypothetical protein ABFS83_08G208600 [Erythranthe nasuta]